MTDEFSLALPCVADVAEHCAANLTKTAGKMDGVDAPTQSAIAGAFMGFAVLLRAVHSGAVDLSDLSKVKPNVMDEILRRAAKAGQEGDHA